MRAGPSGLESGPGGGFGGAVEDLVGGAGGSSGGGSPSELGVVIQGAGEDADVLGLAGSGGEAGESGGVEAGDVGDVVHVDEVDVVFHKDTVFSAGGLVLVVEVLLPLGEADGGEAFLVEAGMVSSAQESVAAEDEGGVEGAG